MDKLLNKEVEYTLLISLKHFKFNKLKKGESKLKQFYFYFQKEFQKVIDSSYSYSEILQKLSHNNNQIFYSSIELNVANKYQKYIDEANELGYTNSKLIKTNIPLGNSKTRRLLSLLVISDIDTQHERHKNAKKINHRKFYVFPLAYEDFHH